MSFSDILNWRDKAIPLTKFNKAFCTSTLLYWETINVGTQYTIKSSQSADLYRLFVEFNSIDNQLPLKLDAGINLRD